MNENPLGKSVTYPQEYAPEALFPISRAETRGELGYPQDLPFHGADLLTAWDLNWLDASGKPVTGVATICLPADSPNLIESKSLKLYLNSLANSRYANAAAVTSIICGDLSAAAQAEVNVDIADMSTAMALGELPGTCIDDLVLGSNRDDIHPDTLTTDSDKVGTEALHTHLLKSNCPITNQPDIGSLLIRYGGPQIDRQSLLDYIVSYRYHNGFHEACVERIFVDIKTHCNPNKLTVYARYNRRGGIDINPFRSDFEEAPDNIRLWRQ